MLSGTTSLFQQAVERVNQIQTIVDNLRLLVFIRRALRSASQNEESAQKINALQASLLQALGKV